MANFKWGTGEQRQNIFGKKGTKTFRGHWNKAVLKGGQKMEKKKHDVAGTYLSLHPLCKFSLHPCGQHGCKQNVELGYEYDEFTLGDWMLSKIIKKLVGSWNTVVV